MSNSPLDQSGEPDSTRRNETGTLADWNIPKPETIPPPTYWPFVLSLGATLVGLGALTSTIITGTGAVLFILAVIKWVGELSSEDR